MITLRRLVLLLAFVAPVFAQRALPTVINPNSLIKNGPVTLNANFTALFNNSIGRWSGAGVPGNVPLSILGDIYTNTATSPKTFYICGRSTNCSAVGAGNWQTVGNSSVAPTSNALIGDGSGNAVAAGGTGTNCLQVNGSNTTCGGLSGLSTTFVPKATSSSTVGNSSLSDNGTTVSTTENFNAGAVSAGASPPAVTGTGIFGLGENTGQGCVAGADCLIADSVSHRLQVSNNNGAVDPLMGEATVDTMTNKAFDTAGTGNSLKIAGTAITAVSGSGAVCLVTGSSCSSGGGVTAKTTNYTLLTTDTGHLITFNGSGLTATLLATPGSLYAVAIKNLNASALTISRNGLTINGGTGNITLQQYQTVACFSDGTNYFCDVPDVAGSAVSLTPASNGQTLAVNITPTTCTGPQMITAISAVGAGTCNPPLITQNSKSADYTAVLGDAGQQIYHPSADTTARTFTIPANGSVAYALGSCITFVNDTSAGVLTIAITSDTLLFAGAGTTGSRTLAASNLATACKIGTTRWIITGSSGLT